MKLNARLKRQPEKPSAEEVELNFYQTIGEGIPSGELLFALHEEYEFTRPGLPARRAQELEAANAPQGSAVQAAGNMILTIAGLLDDAGRQEELESRMVQTIVPYVVACALMEPEMEELQDEEWDISAIDMAQRIDEKYADCATLPPDHVVQIVDEGEAFDFTARLVRLGLDLIQEKFIAQGS